MYQHKEYRLHSQLPGLLMHNGQSANPTNQFAKAIKQISSKRSKTDADFEAMAKLEFMASLYLYEDSGPSLPAENITAMLIKAAQTQRKGKTAASGLFVMEHARLEYDGPRTPEELWKEERFRHVALVNVQRARIARTRPIFKTWTALVKVTYEDQQVNEAQLDEWFLIAGEQVGIGDWRPRFGRFTVTEV